MSLAIADTAGIRSDEIAKLFPLPLSAFETFMVDDATVDYPMMCDMAIEFKGRIDRAGFDAALAVALARAPLFRSLLAYDAKGKPQWVLTDQQPRVHWADYDVPFGDDYDVFVDLKRELSFRVYVRAGEKRSRIMFHFHHACSDGLGAYALADDFLGAYHNAMTPDAPIELRPLKPELLLNRNNSEDKSIRGFRKIYDTWIGIREGIRFFFQKPLSLTPRTPDANLAPYDLTSTVQRPRKQQSYIYELCPHDVAVALRKVAAENKCSLNDILMRDLYLTLAEWDKNSGRKELRVLMPQSLRDKEEEALPPTNRVGFAFLTRRADWRSRPKELLKSLQEETDFIVEGKLSRYFIDGLKTMQQTGLLKRMLRSSTCFSTAVLTNLGNPQRRFNPNLVREGTGMIVGNLYFDAMTGMPPLRNKTAAAFCISGYGQSFIVNLKCDSYAFSREETEALMACYMAQLAATARGETDK
jgi:hypothetical protein